jgi:hypothetical protein
VHRIVRVTRTAAIATLLALAVLTPIANAAPPVTGTHPWVIVLCNFSDDTSTPSPASYFQQMFNGAPSGDGLLEYFRDVSYSGLSISGTVVKGWYTLPMTRYQFSGLNRYNKIKACAQGADSDVDFGSYWGVFAITNFPVDGLPAPVTTTIPGGVADASTTSITVASAAGFPAPPFSIVVDDGTTDDVEEMNVTAVSGPNWTVTRGYEFGTANAHDAGANVRLAYGSDYGSVGITGFPMDGGHNLGTVVGGYTFNAAGAAHEMSHGFGFGHSRKLSDSTNDYSDCWDIMSIFSCVYTFQGTFGGGNLGSPPAASGDGFTAINVDLGGWLPAPRLFTHDNSSCNQTTRTMAALNYPGVSGDLAARIPASVTIPIPGGTTTGDYLWVEYRHKSLWDRAIPASSIVLHLHGQDNRPYWLDQSGGGDGRLGVGEEYVNAAQKTYIAVNAIDTTAHDANVTISGCKIVPTLVYSGDTSGDFDDEVTLAADLRVGGVPVPSAPVTLSIGAQSCAATTDSAGHASCVRRLDQHPGAYTAAASFAGDDAYAAATNTEPFTLTKEESALAYSGDVTEHYHDSFTARATLTDPLHARPATGKAVTFTLGGSDSCTGTTDGAGVATCTMAPTLASGTYSLSASFGPDLDWEDATTSANFTVTPEETTLTYDGPAVILAGSGPATLTALLVEDGANDDDGDSGSPPPDPSGQTVTLALGAQSCTGTVNPSGAVNCQIPSVSTAVLGSGSITATFSGDAYYQPSSDTDSVVVFAFPSTGAFVLGDATVSAADAATRVTWWDHSWSSLNLLTGGSAPPSFKGFASSVTTLPTTSPANSCGASFSTRGGNSPPPADGVPSYMGVVVAGSVAKSGSTIDGIWGRVVVVATDAGYRSDPGHPGTGTIVATFCP